MSSSQTVTSVQLRILHKALEAEERAQTAATDAEVTAQLLIAKTRREDAAVCTRVLRGEEEPEE